MLKVLGLLGVEVGSLRVVLAKVSSLEMVGILGSKGRAAALF